MPTLPLLSVSLPETEDVLREDLAEREATFQADLARGRWDITFFAERFLGIKGHPGQLRGWNTSLRRTADGWSPLYLTICVAAGNRAGKTLWLAILIFHSVVYKLGLKPPSPTSDREINAWVRAPYAWYHFGIQQETAEQVFKELEDILNGIHKAQNAMGCPLVDLLGRDVAETERKYRSQYPWIKLHPMLGGGDIHFRSTAEHAIGSLGKDMNGVSWDECAFDPEFEFVVDEVLHMRRASTGGQMVLISTATEGMSAFADKWREGDPAAPGRRPSSYSLRISSRENIGYGLTQASFDRIVADMPPYLVPQNIDGEFIESKSAFFGSQAVDLCFIDDLPEDDIAIPKHRYAQGVDPAISFDSTWSVTLDFTDRAHVTGVRVRRKTGRQTTLSVSSVVIEGHRAYNTRNSTCVSALDATGFGGKVFRDLLTGLRPLRTVEFGGTRGKKLALLNNLKGGIEKGQLRFPKSGLWLVLRRQLLGYRLNDRKGAWDGVMALAVAWTEVMRHPVGGQLSVDFDIFGAQPTVGVVASARHRSRVASSTTRIAMSSLRGDD